MVWCEVGRGSLYGYSFLFLSYMFVRLIVSSDVEI